MPKYRIEPKDDIWAYCEPWSTGVGVKLPAYITYTISGQCMDALRIHASVEESDIPVFVGLSFAAIKHGISIKT